MRKFLKFGFDNSICEKLLFSSGIVFLSISICALPFAFAIQENFVKYFDKLSGISVDYPADWIKSGGEIGGILTVKFCPDDRCSDAEVEVGNGVPGPQLRSTAHTVDDAANGAIYYCKEYSTGSCQVLRNTRATVPFLNEPAAFLQMTITSPSHVWRISDYFVKTTRVYGTTTVSDIVNFRSVLNDNMSQVYGPIVQHMFQSFRVQ